MNGTRSGIFGRLQTRIASHHQDENTQEQGEYTWWSAIKVVERHSCL